MKFPPLNIKYFWFDYFYFFHESRTKETLFLEIANIAQ